MAASPTAAKPTTRCREHRRRDAVGACASCSAPLCRDCMNPTRVGFKCGTCAGGTKITKAGPSRAQGAPAGGGWLRPVALAVVVAVVLGVVAANLFGGDGTGEGATSDDARSEGAGDGAVERRVQFEGAGDVTIGATLALPPVAPGQAASAGVIIIPGFGPTNRDGVLTAGGAPDTLYADLSATLVDAGLATLRYDKRGTGQSVLAPDEALSFDDMVGDAAAAVGFLAERTEVDPGRIAVLGHEEGGLVALDLAGANPAVAGLVLVSVPGRPLVEVLTDDFNNSGHQEEVGGLQAAVSGVVAGEPLVESDLPPFLRSFFPATQQGYLQDLFTLDPLALATEVDVPTLIVRGEAATGVSAVDADALAGALDGETDVVVAAGAGPTLSIADPVAGAGDAADPASASHEHGAGAPTVVTRRADEALGRITRFLQASTATTSARS